MFNILNLKTVASELEVLCVEDDDDLRKSLYELLKIIFSHVDTASNGAEALDYYNKRAYNIIFTDIKMPIMDGVELITEIRKINSEQKILVISSYAQSSMFVDAIKAGVQGFILKPIIQSEFIDAIYPTCKEAYNNLLTNKMSLELQENKKKLENKDYELDRYSKIIDNNVITSSTDADGTITNVSEAFCRINGYTKEELIGKRHSILHDKSFSGTIYKEMWGKLKTQKNWQGELRNINKDGSIYWVDAKIEAVYDNSLLVGYRAVKHEITDKKRVQELSIRDKLTQLYNISTFDTELKYRAPNLTNYITSSKI